MGIVMATLEKIKSMIKTAMLNKDSITLTSLRSLISESNNIAISNKRKEVTEDDVLLALSRGIKQREDSRATYTNAGRYDLAHIEDAELVVIKSLLPEQMSETELSGVISKVISETGATTQKQMGMVMGKLMPLVKGKADPKLVSSLVTSKLCQ